MRVRESQLRRATLEIDGASMAAGWDQPARLYALVDTDRLLEQEPSLAGSLGMSTDAPGFTAVEQEPLDPARTLEEVLGDIEWPPEVEGCAAAVERLVLPPSAEDSLPDDPTKQRAYAAEHPQRQEVRIVAAVLRDGSAHCALRVRGHDDPQDLLEGPDLVPALTRLLADTLDTDLRD